MKTFLSTLVIKILRKKFVQDEFEKFQQELDQAIKEIADHEDGYRDKVMMEFNFREGEAADYLFREIKRYDLPGKLLVNGEIIRLAFLEEWLALIQTSIQEKLNFFRYNPKMNEAKKLAHFQARKWEVEANIKKMRQIKDEIRLREDYLTELKSQSHNDDLSSSYDKLDKARKHFKKRNFGAGIEQIPPKIRREHPKLIAWQNAFDKLESSHVDGTISEFSFTQCSIKLGLRLMDISDELFENKYK